MVADDFAAARIERESQIQPAFRSGQIRKATQPTERSEIAEGRSLCRKGSAGGRWHI